MTTPESDRALRDALLSDDRLRGLYLRSAEFKAKVFSLVGWLPEIIEALAIQGETAMTERDEQYRRLLGAPRPTKESQ